MYLTTMSRSHVLQTLSHCKIFLMFGVYCFIDYTSLANIQMLFQLNEKHKKTNIKTCIIYILYLSIRDLLGMVFAYPVDKPLIYQRVFWFDDLMV